MTDRNKPGEGNVEPLPSGRFRVRMRIAGRAGRALPGTYATFEEADAVRQAAVAALAAAGRAAVGGLTLKAYGLVVLERRVTAGLRSVDDDRLRFGLHIAQAHFAEWPIQNIRRPDVKRFRDELVRKFAQRAVRTKEGIERRTTERRLSRQTVTNIMNLLRAILDEACEDEIIEQNPALGVKVRGVARTREPWTYLNPEEQVAVLNAIPPHLHALVGFAIGTGMREGELYALRIDDVVLDGEWPHVVVRYGSRHEAPKNGRIRRVPLFGLGLAAAQEQARAMPRLRNHHGLFFPGERGGFRAEGKPPKGWAGFVRKAGVDRSVRWHDLRHTCGASLISGFWGRSWSLDEVQAFLGHVSRQSTERYAHLAPSAVQRAALEANASHGWPTLPASIEQDQHSTEVSRRVRKP